MSKTLQRTALVLWTSLWMLILPWVHVHPEVDHSHGEPGHEHRAVMHTVFSAALDCESHGDAPDDTPADGTQRHSVSSSDSVQPHTHAELDYLLAASSPSPSLDKVILSPVDLIEGAFLPFPMVIADHASETVRRPAMLFFSMAMPLRAPPLTLS